MLFSSIGVSLSILLYGMASAQSFVPTAYHSSLLYGSTLYIFGGYVGKETDKYQKMTSQVAALDLTKDFSLESSPAWSVKSPLPMPIKGPQLAVDGNNGIVLWGGVVPDNVATRKDKVNDAVYRYSIADDKWTKVSEGNPNGRAWPCEYRLATANSKRLYFGGKKDPAANTTNDICYYENGNTQCKSTPNAPRSRHSCVFQEFKPQKYILIGGAIEEDNTLGDIWTFDEPSSAWTLQAGKVSTRSSMNSIMYDKYLIVFGGWPNNNGTSILIDVIDTETFQVTKPQHTGSFPSWNIFYDPSLVLIGNTLLVYGGYSDTTNAVNPTIEVININSQNGLLSFEWTKSYKANQTALASFPRGPLPEGDINASQQSSSNLPIIVGSVVGAAALVAVAGFLLFRRRTAQRKPTQSFPKPSEEVNNVPQSLPQNENLGEPTQHPVLHLSQVYETASTRTFVISTQNHHNLPSHNAPFQNDQAPDLQQNTAISDIYAKHNLPSQYYQPYLDTPGQRNMLVLSSDPHPYMYPSSNRTSIASYSQPPMVYSNISQQPQHYAPVTQASNLPSQNSEEAVPVEVPSSSSLPPSPSQRTNPQPTNDVSQQSSNQEPALPVSRPATPGPSNVKRDGHQYEVSPIQHQMR